VRGIGSTDEHALRAQNPQESTDAATGGLARLSDVGVLALVPDDWHWQWQPRHQVLTRLAKYFPVIWLSPAENWRISLSIRKLLGRRLQRPVAEPNFIVHTPSPFLPEFHSPRWLARMTFVKRLVTARRLLLRMGCRKIVVYLWRPEFASVLDSIPFDLSCYHIDDEYSFSEQEKPIPPVEARLIARVNRVFIHSPALLEKKGKINPNTSFAPNGVDFNEFRQPVSEPSDLAAVPHPRIGYCGHIKKQLDLQLLLDLSKAHPEWFFVLVGAVNAHPEIACHVEELSRRANVFLLGGKTAKELAAYPQHFDVCLMPYREDDYTKYIYPLKLHEYLASGRPIVGTPIRSLEPFCGLVRLARTIEEWSAAISGALGPVENSTAMRQARLDVAKQHDWDTLVRQIAEQFANDLGPPYAELFSKAFS
jgi:glycosyltransferase involved in cell wall biosynthesis